MAGPMKITARRKQTFALLRSQPQPWVELDARYLEEPARGVLLQIATTAFREKYTLSANEECCVNNPATAMDELRFYGVTNTDAASLRASELGASLDSIYPRWSELMIDTLGDESAVVNDWAAQEFALFHNSDLGASGTYTIIAAGASN